MIKPLVSNCIHHIQRILRYALPVGQGNHGCLDVHTAVSQFTYPCATTYAAEQSKRVKCCKRLAIFKPCSHHGTLAL